MKRVMITGLLAIGAACLILGCGRKEGAQEQDKAKTEAAEEKGGEEGKEEEPKEEEDGRKDEAQEEEVQADEAEAEQKVIGTESADAHKILLTNQIGEAITAFSVKASTDADFPENMMAADMRVEKDETVCLYYAPPQAEGTETGTGKMLRTTYEFGVTTENGRELRIAGLIFDDIREAELCFEDEVGFIRYVSVDSGEEISTKEMALMQAQ